MDSEYRSRFTHKAYKDLEFTDDFMFRKVLYNNSELCKDLIELLLGIKVDHIEYKDDDHTIAPAPNSKSVRLDVYAEDNNGTAFDLEMQNLKEMNLPKRTRFYQSMIDIENLSKGAEYDKLPDSYIVFICMFDPYQKGLHKYEFRELCAQDTSIELGSGSSKVFINARSRQGKMSEDMRAFLDFLCGKEARSNLTKDIAADIKRAKAYKPWEAEYMQWNEIISLAEQDARKFGREEGRAEGREEGRAEGRAEARFESVDKLVASGICEADKACDIIGVDPEEYRAHLSFNDG